MSKVFAIKLDEGETELFERCIEASGLKSGASLFRLMLYKYDKEVRDEQRKINNDQ